MDHTWSRITAREKRTEVQRKVEQGTEPGNHRMQAAVFLTLHDNMRERSVKL